MANAGCQLMTIHAGFIATVEIVNGVTNCGGTSKIKEGSLYMLK